MSDAIVQSVTSKFSEYSELDVFRRTLSSSQELSKKLNTLSEINYTAIEKATAELQVLLLEDIVLDKTKETLKFVLDSMVLEGVKRVEQLLTYGLQTVFFDEDLAVRVDLVERRGAMCMDLYMVDRKREIESPITEASGGGPVAVVAFLLRVLSLLNLKLRRFMVLDESFSFVSKKYVPKLAKLLQELCGKLNLDILLVTHQPAFLDQADVSLEAISIGNWLQIKIAENNNK